MLPVYWSAQDTALTQHACCRCRALRVDNGSTGAGVTLSSLAELSMLLSPDDGTTTSVLMRRAHGAATLELAGEPSANMAQAVYLAVAVARNCGSAVSICPVEFVNAAKDRCVLCCVVVWVREVMTRGTSGVCE